MNIVATRCASTAIHIGMFAACLLGMVGVAQHAHAAPLEQTQSVTVAYDSSSLATQRGALALYRRLEQAARQVCGDGTSRDLASVQSARECQKQAVARAVRIIGNPRLVEAVVGNTHRG
jgi:UrcA family protein